MKIKIEEYEKYLSKLSEIIDKLDDSSTSLDESIKIYGQGVEIYEGLKTLLETEKGKLLKFNGKEFAEE